MTEQFPASLQVFSICRSYFKSEVICTPRYLAIASYFFNDSIIQVAIAVADVGFFKGGFIKFLARKPRKNFRDHAHFRSKNAPFSDKFADSATLFALRCEADCILARQH